MEELSIPSLLAAVLVRRGFDTPEVAEAFLNPSLDHLHDPRLLPDYEAAQAVLLNARERNEKIFIHGDYDVDGVTSAALFSRFLTKVGCTVQTHVPHRIKEGYGIHLSVVDEAHAAGAKVFLTCDCGSGALEQIAKAREYGMRVVVTDHHTVGDVSPEAEAFINPHRGDSHYPYPELSGVGVAFKVCEGLNRELGNQSIHYYRAYLDLAALGTIADVMPLTGENRIIAKFGLQRILESNKPGLKALLRESRIAEQGLSELRSYHVGYVLGPRLNAAGRIDDAALALKLLLEREEQAAALLARNIEEINSARKEEQQRILDLAVETVLERGHHERNVIVVGGEDWHPGVIGIVAGRLVEQFRRPAFVGSIDRETGICKASARTIPGFNLANAIRAHFHILLGGGGHAMAAGCSVSADRLEELADALHQYAGGILSAEDFEETYEVDLEVQPGEVNMTSVQSLSRMEPFGCGNPEPLLIARGMTFSQITPTKNPQHVNAVLRNGQGPTVRCIAFGMGERFQDLQPGFQGDVLFQPNLEDWNGGRYLKWRLKDFYVA